MQLLPMNIAAVLHFLLRFSAVTAAAADQSDSELIRNFDMFARYSAAAYCGSLVDGNSGTKVCDKTPDACTGLHDAITVSEFTDRHTISGNVAVSKSQKLIVVGFRGTDVRNLRDVLNDMRACPRQPKALGDLVMWKIKALCGLLPSNPADTQDAALPLCDRCLVHRGFWSAFQGIKDKLMAAVLEQQKQNPGFSVVASGHSLGGAVATLAGAYMRKTGIAADIYTFGSPRVGDDVFAEFVSNQSNGKTFRITNAADPVTVIPGISAGYAHTTPEFWFPDSVSQPQSMRKCEGVGNTKCSAQFLFNLRKVGDHSSVNYAKGFNACKKRDVIPDVPDFTQELVDELMTVGILDNSTEAINF